MIKPEEDKRGAELSVNVIIIVIIALLVLVVLVAVFTGRIMWFNNSTTALTTSYCPGTNKAPIHTPSDCDGFGVPVPYGRDKQGQLYCCSGWK